MLYWDIRALPERARIRADLSWLKRTGGLLLSFMLGGMAGRRASKASALYSSRR